MADDGSRVPDSTSRAIASALFQDAGKAFQRGEYAAAADRFDAARALYTTIPGTESEQANCLFNAGAALGNLGEHATAADARRDSPHPALPQGPSRRTGR